MKLQIAFNSTDLEKDLSIVKSIQHFADQIEIGPIALYQHGLNAIK
jgi:3-keto-L-gulonate-6-phosphate decarboxylase